VEIHLFHDQKVEHCQVKTGRRGGAAGFGSDLPSTSGHFDLQSVHGRVTTGTSCSQSCASVIKQYNLVPVSERDALRLGR